MLLALGLFLLVPIAGAHRPGNDSVVAPRRGPTRAFLVTSHQPDGGEVERIVNWPAFCAKETIVRWGDTDIALREVWLENTGRKLQFIYEDNILTDCIDGDFMRDDWQKSCELRLLAKTDGEKKVEIIEFNGRNVSSSLPPNLSWISSEDVLQYRCSHVRSLAQELIIERKRHRERARPESTRGNARRGKRGRSRSRRELFLMPGTQWCGRGHRAAKYTSLGGFSVADACCRKHDTACPFFIPSFETRYGLFNWGISTMMHCSCDERFRTCLKMAGTSSADFIGKIFFDVFQTKCFVLKPQKVCVKRSWWGKCERYTYKKQAHVRDNVSY